MSHIGHIELADLIAKKMISESFRNPYNEEVNWIGKARSLDGLYDVMPYNNDLYDGKAGIGVFFTLMYNQTGDNVYKEISKRIYHNLVEKFEKEYKEGVFERDLKQTSPSLLTYPMSIVYLASFLSGYVSEFSFDMKIAKKLNEVLNRIIFECKEHDFLTGFIGGLYSKWYLSTFFNEPIKMDSSLLIDELNRRIHPRGLNVAFPYLDKFKATPEVQYHGGFAHGSSSAAHVLSILASYYNSNKINDFSTKFLNHDNSYYRSDIGGWLDSRHSDIEIDSCAWCHGTTGIVLSRLIMMQYNKDIEPLFKMQRYQAFKLIAQKKFNESGLCHGNFGNLEVLKVLARNINQVELLEKINQIESKVIDRFYEKEIKNISNYRGGNTLFLGLAGIGYNLIRLKNIDKIPSVLALDSPNLEFKKLYSYD